MEGRFPPATPSAASPGGPNFSAWRAAGAVRRRPSPCSRAARESAETESLPGARIGLTVTRSVGGAVERNRVRRRLKEALRAAQPLETEGDCDYVLMARREALGRRFAALVDDVRKTFRAARRGADGRRRRSDARAPEGEDRQA